MIIPIYNSRECLPHLYRRLTDSLVALGRNYEIIMVEDGGRDDSWDYIAALEKSDPKIRGIKLGRNFGQHNALLCGIRAAKMDIAITIDDDLQNPPEEIAVLLRKMEEGHAVVYGTPDQERHGLWRNMASVMTKMALQKAMGAATAGKVSAFRAFRTDLREAFHHFQGPHLSIDVLLTWGTSRFAAVQVRHEARSLGVSQYSVGKLFKHALNMVTGFSTLPLRLASWMGFLFTFLGIMVLVYVLGRYVFKGSSVPGFPFLASIIAIFSGAQLFALGIMGEYLARIHLRTMNKPAYVVDTLLTKA